MSRAAACSFPVSLPWASICRGTFGDPALPTPGDAMTGGCDEAVGLCGGGYGCREGMWVAVCLVTAWIPEKLPYTLLCVFHTNKNCDFRDKNVEK